MLQAKRKSSIEDDMPKKKSRKYIDTYLDFGLKFILKNGEQKHQWIICNKILTSESMLPNKLKQHLASSHPQFASKPRNIFAQKSNDEPSIYYFEIYETHIKGFISILSCCAQNCKV